MLSNVRSLNNLVGFHPGIRHYMKFGKFTWISTPPTTSPAIPDFTWKLEQYNIWQWASREDI